MGRRRHVALASAIAILLMGIAIAVVLVGLTRSTRGRDFIRAQVQRGLASVSHGTVHVGALGGSFLTDLTIDSLEIREPSDSLFFASGPIRLTFDPRDIVDGVILLRSLDVQRPFVRLQRRHDEWSYRSIWPASNGPSTGPNRGFGSRISLSNVRIRGGEVHLLMPWTPADSLHGARRDSAITAALKDTQVGVRRIGANEFEKEWLWTDINVQLAHAHLADPDTAGQHFEIVRADVVERWPPLAARNVRGTIWRRGDSLYIDIPHFDLPASTGSAKGKVWWSNDLPMRYDVSIHGDSVALADVAWVYNTLPSTGGGKMDLRIRNERDLHIIDYVLSGMDMHTMNSRLRGAMTFGVGAPVLIIKDVALEALPIDFRLIERFSGKPLPMPWRGAITGTVRARGGPVNRWQVDDARFSFADFNVPGATTRATAHGGLDILFPAFTSFRGFSVDVAQLDLRTLQFLMKDFPRLNGTVSGHAMLDSSWLDVRFTDGDFTLHNGDAPVSRFRGAGRVTYGQKFMRYDVSLAALPLSFTGMARSFPGIPARGDFSGPLRVKGTSQDLAVTADLVGDAGRFEVDGTFDISPPGYRASAHGRVSGLDLRRLLDRSSMPPSEIALRWTADVTGDSLANLRGTAEVHIDRSMIDSVRVYGGEARLRFLGGTLAVDSLHIESAALSATAHGSLALAPGHAGDSVSFVVALDSLGGFRRTLLSAAGSAPDTSALEGTLRVEGSIGGVWPAVRVNADAHGADFHVGSLVARQVDGSARLTLPLDSLRGTMTARLEGVAIGTVRLNNITASADLPSAGHAVGEVKAELSSGPELSAHADAAWSGDTTDVRVDRVRVVTKDNAWALLAPSRIIRAGSAWTVDSLVVVGRTAGRISLRGAIPDVLAINARLDATDVPLADIGELLQTKSPMSGRAQLSAQITGTRDAPLMALSASLRDALVAGVNVKRADASGTYVNRRVVANLRAFRGDVTALHVDADLPVDLSLHSVPTRLLEDEPLRATISSDSGGIAFLETLTSEVTHASGSLVLNANISGTMRSPKVNGALRVTNAGFDLPSLGTTWRDVDVDIGFTGDSIAIRNVAATSGDRGTSRSTLTGFIGLRDLKDPTFDLRLSADNFNAIHKRRVADLDLSGALRIAGATTGSALTGAITVDRGTIYIPDIFTKDLISLDDPELMNVVDTAALADHGILPRTPSRVIENLRVENVPITMGRDVTLKSSEANITLGGEVSITAARVQRGRDAGRYQLALDGAVQTVRGTYRLNLGPVQRTFEVEGGEVRFRGDPDPNLGELDIRAVHTVRTFSQSSAQQDVRVRVNIGGTLGSPRATLSSPDSGRVTESDLYSYLMTGGPSSEIIGRNGNPTTTAYRVALGSFGSVLGSKVPASLCTDAQFSTATLDQYRGIRDIGSSVLSGSRFNCAKQLGERVFFRIDAGLCSVGQLLGQGGSFDSRALAEAMGFKIDYRFNYGVSASVGIDPSTSAALCSREAIVRGFAPTPRQIGVDLYRAWQF